MVSMAAASTKASAAAHPDDQAGDRRVGLVARPPADHVDQPADLGAGLVADRASRRCRPGRRWRRGRPGWPAGAAVRFRSGPGTVEGAGRVVGRAGPDPPESGVPGSDRWGRVGRRRNGRVIGNLGAGVTGRQPGTGDAQRLTPDWGRGLGSGTHAGCRGIGGLGTAAHQPPGHAPRRHDRPTNAEVSEVRCDREAMVRPAGNWGVLPVSSATPPPVSWLADLPRPGVIVPRTPAFLAGRW